MNKKELHKAAEEFYQDYSIEYLGDDINSVDFAIAFHLHQNKKMIEEAEKANPFLYVSDEDGTYIKAFMKAQSDGYNAALNKLKEISK